VTSPDTQVKPSEKVLQNFPHKEYREFQKETILLIDEYFKKGVKFILYEGPTGSGKSAVSMTLGLSYEDTFTLTSQKILQDQYINDFCDDKRVKVLKGRTNYTCTKRRNTNCHDGEILVSHCGNSEKNYDCTYVMERNAAFSAKVMLLNYNYFFSAISLMHKRDLLICDEAHQFESILMQHTEFTLTNKLLKKYDIENKIPDYPYINDYLKWLSELAQDLIYVINDISDEIHALGNNVQVKPKIQERDSLRRLCDNITGFLDSNEFTEWVFDYKKKEGWDEIIFKPLKIDYFIKKYFAKADKHLFMSATILDHNIFCRNLGINPAEVYFLKIPSTFPPEKSPIYYMNIGKMSYQFIRDTFPNMIKVLSEILEKHKDDKGIIHTHSFKISKHIKDNLGKKDKKNFKRLIFTGSDDRDVDFNRHKEADYPSVLASPSMTEGVDLYDDLALFAILVKIPYPSIADKQIKRRMEIDPEWYTWKTCFTIVQSVGRGTRHDKDHCKIYLLDSSFRWFIEKNSRYFPQHFLNAIQ